jgi:hypothetical protein
MKFFNTFNKFITEMKSKADDITCFNCSWSWKLKEGGKDPYVCHKCGFDNEDHLV